MSANNLQFSIASHILTVLAYRPAGHATSKELAQSISANPTFIRRTIARLGKAGLVVTTRGASGTCTLARPAQTITLLDIYNASEASPVFSVHSYPVNNACEVGTDIKGRMNDVLQAAQTSFEVKLESMTLLDLMPRKKCPEFSLNSAT